MSANQWLGLVVFSCALGALAARARELRRVCVRGREERGGKSARGAPHGYMDLVAYQAFVVVYGLFFLGAWAFFFFPGFCRSERDLSFVNRRFEFARGEWAKKPADDYLSLLEAAANATAVPRLDFYPDFLFGWKVCTPLSPELQFAALDSFRDGRISLREYVSVYHYAEQKFVGSVANLEFWLLWPLWALCFKYLYHSCSVVRKSWRWRGGGAGYSEIGQQRAHDGDEDEEGAERGEGLYEDEGDQPNEPVCLPRATNHCYGFFESGRALGQHANAVIVIFFALQFVYFLFAEQDTVQKSSAQTTFWLLENLHAPVNTSTGLRSCFAHVLPLVEGRAALQQPLEVGEVVTTVPLRRCSHLVAAAADEDDEGSLPEGGQVAVFVLLDDATRFLVSRWRFKLFFRLGGITATTAVILAWKSPLLLCKKNISFLFLLRTLLVFAGSFLWLLAFGFCTLFPETGRALVYLRSLLLVTAFALAQKKQPFVPEASRSSGSRSAGAADEDLGDYFDGEEEGAPEASRPPRLAPVPLANMDITSFRDGSDSD
jgi:hypothetical protein